MNFIDMFVAVLLIYAVVRGIARGFVMQIASLGALLAGIFGALFLSGLTTRFLTRYWNVSHEYLYLLSLAITFAGVFILVNLVGNLVSSGVESTRLSFLNKLLGAAFNVCKVMIITGVILLLVDRVDRHISLLPDHAREGSFFYGPVTRATLILFPALGKDREQRDHAGEEFV